MKDTQEPVFGLQNGVGRGGWKSGEVSKSGRNGVYSDHFGGSLNRQNGYTRRQIGYDRSCREPNATGEVK